ncbi:hypothetical protein Hanom_Chr16g01464451 [Helianthus anomalus]
MCYFKGDIVIYLLHTFQSPATISDAPSPPPQVPLRRPHPPQAPSRICSDHFFSLSLSFNRRNQISLLAHLLEIRCFLGSLSPCSPLEP